MPATLVRRLLRFSDSHCHIKAAVVDAEAVVTAGVAEHSPSPQHHVHRDIPHVRHVVVCGTHPAIDWELVASLTPKEGSDAATTTPATLRLFPGHPEGSTQVIAGFGIHPWFVPEFTDTVATSTNKAESVPAATASFSPPCQCATVATNALGEGALTQDPTHVTLDGLLAHLEAKLTAHPHAIVAEIGLDKLRGPSEAAQVEAFLAQLRLAARHQRPVSVHCVRHYGLLLKVLSNLTYDETPPAIILHAYTGSLDIAKSLLMLKNKKKSECVDPTFGKAKELVFAIKKHIFFGIGCNTSAKVKNFVEETLPYLVKSGRVLLETDEHYQLESTSSSSPVAEMRCDGEAVYTPLVALAVCVAELEAGEEASATSAATRTADKVEEDFLNVAEANFRQAFAMILGGN